MLLLSQHSLHSFKNCRKQYQISYEMGLRPVRTTDAIELGSSFHKLMEWAANGDMTWVNDQTSTDGMDFVAAEYLAHRPLPAHILGVEKPLWINMGRFEGLELGDQSYEQVWLRCTFDLIYTDNGWIVARDYKTFDRAPSYNIDIDFQMRIYLAVLSRYYGTNKVRFEYENVRRTAPGVPHNKKGECWSPEECYITIPVVLPQSEMDTLWEETQWVIDDLVETRRNGRWYRQDRKGWSGCDSCLQRDLCSAEVQQGKLDPQTISLLSTPQEPLVLPKEYAERH